VLWTALGTSSTAAYGLSLVSGHRTDPLDSAKSRQEHASPPFSRTIFGGDTEAAPASELRCILSINELHDLSGLD
jgi:hypothetical protein